MQSRIRAATAPATAHEQLISVYRACSAERIRAKMLSVRACSTLPEYAMRARQEVPFCPSFLSARMSCKALNEPACHTMSACHQPHQPVFHAATVSCLHRVLPYAVSCSCPVCLPIFTRRKKGCYEVAALSATSCQTNSPVCPSQTCPKPSPIHNERLREE